MSRIAMVSVRMVKDSSNNYPGLGSTIKKPDDVNDIVNRVLDINSSTVEKFGILLLDNKNKVIGIHILTIGTVNASLVSPRDVFQSALLANAVHIIAFHNHPSGDSTPSREDVSITKRLAEAGKIMGIELLDHIVIGDNNFYSLKNNGVI